MSESDIKPKRKKKSAAKSAEDKAAVASDLTAQEAAEAPVEIKAETKAEPKPEPKAEPVPVAKAAQGINVELTPASDFSIIKADTSASVVFGLMAVMGVIMYFSYTAFKEDYMLLFCGLFVFLGVYPSLNLKVKNPNSKIILEVSIAFALCMGVFLILKSMHFPLDQHNKVLIIFVTLLGMRFIFFPAYNVGVAEEQKASS